MVCSFLLFLISFLTDAQISEVAKMLYNEGLTELIPSSPSEQVAYLLVERASLLGKSEDPDKLTVDGKPAISVEAQALNICQVVERKKKHFLCVCGIKWLY